MSMTKKEFKRAMQCGLGRCVQELKTTREPEKYKDAVLWACTHECAYDAQCEGTRSHYLYEMVKCFPDESPFVEAASSYLARNIADPRWGFLYACGFLELSARNGNLSAAGILRDYYGLLYMSLKQTKRRLPDGTLPLCDHFEHLCISVVNLAKTQEEWDERYFQTVEDLGILFLDQPMFTYWNFEEFQWYGEKRRGKTALRRILKEKAKTSRGIRAWLQSMRKQESYWKNECAGKQRKMMEDLTAVSIYKTLKAGGRVGRALPVMAAAMLLKDGREDEVKQLAEYYRKETEPSIRSQLLWLLGRRTCSVFLDAEAVIQDAQSENDSLSENAFSALEYITDDKVHDFAARLLSRKEHTEDVIYMLSNNYRQEDHDILVSLVTALPVTLKETVPWHGPYMAVLRMSERGGTEHFPRELLPYIYEHTLCSCCRFSALKEMSRRRMATEEILKECLYDSYEDIRKFAESKLKRAGTDEIPSVN